MAELHLKSEPRQEREYSVAEIRRLAERFRHLAQDLSDVFIVASRQSIIRQVETDPEEEETREGLRFFQGLKRRFLERRRRVNYSKPQLVKAPKAEVPQAPIQKAVQKAAAPQEVVTPKPQQRSQYTVKIEDAEKKAKPMPAAAGSLFEAAAGYRATLEEKFQPKPEVSTAATVHSPKPTALKLSSEELPRFKKYRDIGEQFLTSKQFPHFRTLLEKARGELSPEAFNLLIELGNEHGFSL